MNDGNNYGHKKTIHNCFTHINHHEIHHNNVGKWW